MVARGDGGVGGMLKLQFDRYITTSKICSDPLDKLFKINKLILNCKLPKLKKGFRLCSVHKVVNCNYNV